jgi:hypothetical protein
VGALSFFLVKALAIISAGLTGGPWRQSPPTVSAYFRQRLDQ